MKHRNLDEFEHRQDPKGWQTREFCLRIGLDLDEPAPAHHDPTTREGHYDRLCRVSYDDAQG